MTSIAITGASGLVGGALLGVLGDVPGVERIVAIDVREPSRRARGLEFHRADVARSELKPLLERCDVLVHLASVVDPVPDEALMARVNVDGTRRVLDAAAAVGIGKVVRVSSAAVYGAWPNNPVPLTEDAPLRPNPGFSPGVQAAEVERLLAEWRDDHPSVVVTTLRAAPVLGPGAERLPSRLMLGRPPLRIAGASPPVQAVHVDDLVAALALVVLEDHPGTFNVASDGWLDATAARAVLPPRVLPPLPAELVERVLAGTWAAGLGDVPPGVVPYLAYPWVVANDRLRALGWSPAHTNEQAIIDGLAALGPPPSRVRTWLVTAAALLGVLTLAGVVRRGFRRRARRADAGRGRRASRPTPR
ncbi:MAG TPA: NAD-dependent epimerase/dehydratase family protein [Acidimicrobiia bacterium]